MSRFDISIILPIGRDEPWIRRAIERVSELADWLSVPVKESHTYPDDDEESNHAFVLIGHAQPVISTLNNEALAWHRARTGVLIPYRAIHDKGVTEDLVASYHVAFVRTVPVALHAAVVGDTRVDYEFSLAAMGAIFSGATLTKTYQWRSGLTYMEMRVLRLNVLGYVNEEIASLLSLSESTVRSHIYNIVAKLSLNGRDDLQVFLRDAIA